MLTFAGFVCVTLDSGENFFNSSHRLNREFNSVKIRDNRGATGGGSSVDVLKSSGMQVSS